MDSGPQPTSTATAATILFQRQRPHRHHHLQPRRGSRHLPCTNPWNATNLAVGAHTLTISATNAGGTGSASYSWTIVPAPVPAPTVTITNGPLTTTAVTTASIAFTTTDPTATIDCSLDGSDRRPRASPDG